jgi:hypothetical protein
MEICSANRQILIPRNEGDDKGDDYKNALIKLYTFGFEVLTAVTTKSSIFGDINAFN